MDEKVLLFEEGATQTLITNIDFAEIAPGVRIQGHALLISPPAEKWARLSGPPCSKLTFFGVDWAQPVATIWLDGPETNFEIVDAADPSMIIMGDATPEGRPIFSGGLLKIQDREFFLQAADHRKPFQVDEFDANLPLLEGPDLRGLVARFWLAPFMPTLTWGTADAVRALSRS